MEELSDVDAHGVGGKAAIPEHEASGFIGRQSLGELFGQSWVKAGDYLVVGEEEDWFLLDGLGVDRQSQIDA